MGFSDEVRLELLVQQAGRYFGCRDLLAGRSRLAEVLVLAQEPQQCFHVLMVEQQACQELAERGSLQAAVLLAALSVIFRAEACCSGPTTDCAASTVTGSSSGRFLWSALRSTWYYEMPLSPHMSQSVFILLASAYLSYLFRQVARAMSLVLHFFSSSGVDTLQYYI